MLGFMHSDWASCTASSATHVPGDRRVILDTCERSSGETRAVRQRAPDIKTAVTVQPVVLGAFFRGSLA